MHSSSVCSPTRTLSNVSETLLPRHLSAAAATTVPPANVRLAPTNAIPAIVATVPPTSRSSTLPLTSLFSTSEEDLRLDLRLTLPELRPPSTTQYRRIEEEEVGTGEVLMRTRKARKIWTQKLMVKKKNNF
ncbi:hypothetical protein NL676_007862 [Syzygium grande]|nr:hypothetical protein NL676_007862 [Syzygium grande]